MTLYGNRPPAGDEGYGAVFTTVHDDRFWFVRAIYLPSVGAVQYGAPPEVIRATAALAEAWGRAVAEARAGSEL